MGSHIYLVSLGLLLALATTQPLKAASASDACLAKWARSESMGGSYGEAMHGIQMSAPECYCQADLSKVKTMGPEVTSSYLKKCRS